MSRTLTRFAVKTMGSVGLCAAAIALSPTAAAAPLKTGGYECIAQSAATDPAAGAAALCAPVADMAGIPLALPGPLPVGAAAVGVPPIPVVVPPVPVGVPPVPVGVPPVPVGVPPVPVGVPPVPVGVPPVPVGAAALPVGGAFPVGAPLPVGAPIIDMAGGYGGKGAPTGPAAAGAPASGQPIMPGPTGN